MREKLSEYAAEGAAWPLTASILDPVRLSVICDGPQQILEVVSMTAQTGKIGCTKHFDWTRTCRLSKSVQSMRVLSGGFNT